MCCSNCGKDISKDKVTYTVGGANCCGDCLNEVMARPVENKKEN